MSDHLVNSALTPQEVCELPHEDRKAYVESILIEHQQFTDLRKRILRAIRENRKSAERKCLLITGGTGAGKTTLLESCFEPFVEEIRDDIRIQPGILVTFTPPPRIKNVAACMLRGFKDPNASRGEKLDMENRIIYFQKICETQVVFGDEIQELWNKDAKKVMHEATNWMKYMIKSLTAAWILTGLEGEAELVINSNPQLKRLFGKPLVLRPLGWSTEAEKAEFIQFLFDVNKQLPFPSKEGSKEIPFLAKEDTALRCYVSCRGNVGYLMKILRGAANLALDDRKNGITLDYLETSFEENGILEIDNPFSGRLPSWPLPQIKG